MKITWTNLTDLRLSLRERAGVVFALRCVLLERHDVFSPTAILGVDLQVGLIFQASMCDRSRATIVRFRSEQCKQRDAFIMLRGQVASSGWLSHMVSLKVSGSKRRSRARGSLGQTPTWAGEPRRETCLLISWRSVCFRLVKVFLWSLGGHDHCVARECHDGWASRRGDFVHYGKLSFHGFPKDEKIRHLWVPGVNRSDFQVKDVNRNTVLYSVYFHNGKKKKRLRVIIHILW